MLELTAAKYYGTELTKYLRINKVAKQVATKHLQSGVGGLAVIVA